MQVNLNVRPQSNYAQNGNQSSAQNNQNQPSFGIAVSKNLLKAAHQNLTGDLADLGEDFFGKVSELRAYGNNTTVYNYNQKEGRHILSIVDCKTIGEKFFPQKSVELEKQESFVDLICGFINRNKKKVLEEQALVTQKNENNAYNELRENAPDINF